MNRAWAILLVFLFSSLGQGQSGGKDILDPAERRWLTANLSRLALAVETGYAPFVFLDANGQPTGLAHDYLRLVEDKLGVRFPQKRYSNLNEIFEKVRSGDVQIVNAVTRTPSRSTFLLFTDVFISVPNVIVVRKEHGERLTEGDLAARRVSLVKSYAITEDLLARGLVTSPDLTPDDRTALLNVSFGRSEAAVIDLATASYLITQLGITNLRVAGETSYPVQLAMGATLSEPMLRTVLQKGLDAITEAERKELRDRWISLTGPPGLLLDKRFWAIVGTVLAALLLGVTAILVWNRMLRRQVVLRTKALAQEKESLRESRAALDLVLNTVPQSIFWKDRDGRYLGCNRTFAHAAGLAGPDQIVGQQDEGLSWREEWIKACALGHREVLETDRPLLHRIEEHRLADGSSRWSDISLVPLRDEQGGAFAVLGVREDITERKKAEGLLQRSLAEKDVLLREVHHRVKNNLSVISGLLSLQTSAIKTPAQALRALQNSRDRVRSITMVHQELYQSRDHAHVDMGQYLKNLVHQLQDAYAPGGAMCFSVEAEGIVLSVNTSIPCGLIINELVTNALKHAFPARTAGRIDVRFHRLNEQEFEFSVADNGVGLPESANHGKNGGAMGLTLVRMLAGQLGGSMTISAGQGTTIQVRFPVVPDP